MKTNAQIRRKRIEKKEEGARKAEVLKRSMGNWLRKEEEKKPAEKQEKEGNPVSKEDEVFVVKNRQLNQLLKMLLRQLREQITGRKRSSPRAQGSWTG